MEIFRFNRFFFEEYGYFSLSAEDCSRLDDQTLYNKIFVNKENDYLPYEVRFLNRHSNSHISQPPCEVCLSGECRMSCQVPETKNTLETVLAM